MTYTHGHHESVLRSHKWRTVDNSAAYLAPHLASGNTVLDLGCGPGTITVDIAARVAPGRVVGIDPSAAVIEEARRNASGRPNVEFRVGDVYALELHDDAFDGSARGGQRFVNDLFQADVFAFAIGGVRGEHRSRSAGFDAIGERLRAEAREDDRVNRADSDRRQHQHDRVERRRHVDGDAIAFADAEAAFAALLATGQELHIAVSEALSFLDQSLDAGFRPGMGHVVPDRFFWALPSAEEGEESPEATPGEPADENGKPIHPRNVH